MACNTHLGRRFSGAVALLVVAALAAKADTVVLKNDQRIGAERAWRENGKVICETPAGRLVLPESMVARIDKTDDAGLSSTMPIRSASGVRMDLSPLNSSGDAAQIARAVIHDGALDGAVLGELDAAASSRAPGAAARAAAAESAASRFEFDRADLDQALRHAERAVEFAPQPPALLNAAYLHLRHGDYAAALAYLLRARPLAPDSPDVAKLTGWALYALNRLPQAVAEWKRAQQLAPDAEVATVLAKAERELQTEGAFLENQSPHFVLKYSGSAAPELSRGVLQALEDDFVEISSALRYSPAEPIAVVLYTNQAFADITRAPSWVGALNDGKIRIPVQGLSSVTPELDRILKHELTHSFISDKTHGRCPIWLQEGVAQWMEGKRAGHAAAMLLALYDRHQDPSLLTLEGSWMTLSPDLAAIAYAWSLAVVEAIDSGDSGDMDRLLDQVAAAPSAEMAVRNVLRMGYDNLGAATAAYLRRAY